MSKSKISSYMLTFEQVDELFTYNPDTGEFITKKKTSDLYPVGGVRPFSMAKSKSKARPHACIKVLGNYRRATHLAFLLMTKSRLPDGWGIFLRDDDTTNLKWDNLVPLPTNSGGIRPEPPRA